jgi:hypothetical protein
VFFKSTFRRRKIIADALGSQKRKKRKEEEKRKKERKA